MLGHKRFLPVLHWEAAGCEETPPPREPPQNRDDTEEVSEAELEADRQQIVNRAWTSD
jgi:hypothetical protein